MSLRSRLIRKAKKFSFILIRRGTRYGIKPYEDIIKLSNAWLYGTETFFDVGANDGSTAKETLSTFPRAKVISFEPHPNTFALLNKRFANTARHRSVNIALGDKTGETLMFEYEDSNINSLVQNARYPTRFGLQARSIPVLVTTIDAFCRHYSIAQIDVLKIDTEGFDLSVLAGGRSMLQSGAVKFVYVEFNDLRRKEGVSGGALVDFDDFLRPYGYRFIAAYNDYVVTTGELFAVSNALFALPPATA